MSPPDVAQARLDAKVRAAARELLDTIGDETPKRDGTVGLAVGAEHLTELRIAVRASEALAEVTSEVA